MWLLFFKTCNSLLQKNAFFSKGITCIILKFVLIGILYIMLFMDPVLLWHPF